LKKLGHESAFARPRSELFGCPHLLNSVVRLRVAKYNTFP
jgi:hypothetical protein